MPTIRIPPGIVRGESKAMEPQRWYETNLIRWQNGIMRPIGGWERQNSSPLPSVPRNGHVWRDNNGYRHAAYICDAHVFREQDGVFKNITPPGFIDMNMTGARGYGSGNYDLRDYGMDDEDRGSGLGTTYDRPNCFNLENWNDEILFASSADGRIFVWDPKIPNTAPWQAENAPTFIQAFLVTDEHHLMTFGSGQPNRVAWSDQGNRAGWDFMNVTGQAGFYDLENAGAILTAFKIPGGILVFTSNSVWIGRYVGAPYFYGFNRIATGCAPISAHSVAVAGTKVYWMGKRNMWKYEGGIVTPVAHTLGLDPFENIFDRAAPRRVTAGYNGTYPEVWWFYPEDQGLGPVQTENNRYIVHNFEEGWWADGWMHRSFFKANQLDGDLPMAGDDMGWLYQHEIGYQAEGNSRDGMVWATVGNLSFDDGEYNWQVNQMQINSPRGPESVEFEFHGQRSRGGPEVLLQRKTPRPDGYLDLHFTAKDFSMKVIGKIDGPWALGAMNFNDVKRRGKV